jgi:hypothetical protein
MLYSGLNDMTHAHVSDDAKLHLGGLCRRRPSVSGTVDVGLRHPNDLRQRDALRFACWQPSLPSNSMIICCLQCFLPISNLSS